MKFHELYLSIHLPLSSPSRLLFDAMVLHRPGSRGIRCKPPVSISPNARTLTGPSSTKQPGVLSRSLQTPPDLPIPSSRSAYPVSSGQVRHRPS